MEPLIQIRDLEVLRGTYRALCLNSLDIQQGEILAIVGPNGAGKSTLLLALAHLLKPTRGAIFFEGRSLTEWDDLEYRRRIALVFEQPLLLNTSLLENVMLGLRFRKLNKNEARQRATIWLERLGIGALANRHSSQLSAGEAQRASLARAFVLEPQLFLLDEPFSSLDPPSRLNLLKDLKSLLSQDHRTAVFITHHLQEAALVADRVAVLMHGKLRQIGQIEEIKAHPVDEEVSAFCQLFQ